MTNKTPWNPSKKATERVKNPLPVPETCPHCGSPVEVVNNSEIYGREYGEWPWAYRCVTDETQNSAEWDAVEEAYLSGHPIDAPEWKEACGAYVGMHPFTDIPLGVLATKEMREARKRCKPAFIRLYASGKMSRNDAYKVLAEKMGLKKEECHWAWFDVAQCEKAKTLCEAIWRELTKPKKGTFAGKLMNAIHTQAVS